MSERERAREREREIVGKRYFCIRCGDGRLFNWRYVAEVWMKCRYTVLDLGVEFCKRDHYSEICVFKKWLRFLVTRKD